jgi:hypothetical protein
MPNEERPVELSNAQVQALILRGQVTDLERELAEFRNKIAAGYRLIGPAEAAVLDRVRDLDRNSITIMETSEWLPLVALAEAIEKL